MVIFDRKTLSNRDENGKFDISSSDLPKTDIKVKKVHANFLQHGKQNSNLYKYFIEFSSNLEKDFYKDYHFYSYHKILWKFY